MSIDAIIDGVEPCTEPYEGVKLTLRDPAPGRDRGQNYLIVVNPPPYSLDVVIGMHIWGGSGSVHIGSRKWAERIGYTRIQLLPPTPGGPDGAESNNTNKETT